VNERVNLATLQPRRCDGRLGNRNRRVTLSLSGREQAGVPRHRAVPQARHRTRRVACPRGVTRTISTCTAVRERTEPVPRGAILSPRRVCRVSRHSQGKSKRWVEWGGWVGARVIGPSQPGAAGNGWVGGWSGIRAQGCRTCPVGRTVRPSRPMGEGIITGGARSARSASFPAISSGFNVFHSVSSTAIGHESPEYKRFEIRGRLTEPERVCQRVV
jgi:hypothetical protein